MHTSEETDLQYFVCWRTSSAKIEDVILSKINGVTQNYRIQSGEIQNVFSIVYFTNKVVVIMLLWK